MPVWGSQKSKDTALLNLLKYLEQESNQPLDANNPSLGNDRAKAKAYDDAAQRLEAILALEVAGPTDCAPADAPPLDHMVLTFAPEDMCVAVITPAGTLGKNLPRTLTFDRNSQEVMDGYVDPLTKAIVGAMLDNAREQLDG